MEVPRAKARVQQNATSSFQTLRFFVGGERLELSTLSGHGPKPCAYANSATRPRYKAL